jgi:hypothetical protein
MIKEFFKSLAFAVFGGAIGCAVALSVLYVIFHAHI